MYKKEFSLAMDVVSMIYKKTDILLSESDAGFIAMHFIKASKNDYQIMLYINEIVNIIKEKIKINPFDNFKKYSDLINTIKEILSNEIEDDISDIYDLISSNFEEIVDIVSKIDKYIYDNFSKKLNKSEYVYLIIKIKRFMEAKK